jgi:hypothetical protein
MVRVTISTTIDPKIHQIIKSRGWKVPELISIGIKNRLSGQDFEKRINATEETLHKLGVNYQKMAEKNYYLEQKLKEMRQKYEN